MISVETVYITKAIPAQVFYERTNTHSCMLKDRFVLHVQDPNIFHHWLPASGLRFKIREAIRKQEGPYTATVVCKSRSRDCPSYLLYSNGKILEYFFGLALEVLRMLESSP